MRTIADAILRARPCPCACHATLAVDERAQGIGAVYHCDDALRGWGYTPLYEVHGDALWKEAQAKSDASYRGVAVRFGECIYRRLVGSMIHEVIHAALGDTSRANYGVPFGLPYGVPSDVSPAAEEAYLAPFNFGEARAFVGVPILARALFGIAWTPTTARDVGTYGFVGGNAFVPVPSGFRAIAHVDRHHHTERYYARARRLEGEARAWFDAANIDAVRASIDRAAERGRATRPTRYPDAAEAARRPAQKIARNEPCPCGSNRKVKSCCGATVGGAVLPSR